MLKEELEKENEALKELNARLVYSVSVLIKRIEEYRAILETKEKNGVKNPPINASSTIVEKLMKRVAELPFSVRTLNVLYAGDCYTLGDIVKLQKTDLLKFRNFGKNSLNEINDFVDASGLSWGMDVDGIFEAYMKKCLNKEADAKD